MHAPIPDLTNSTYGEKLLEQLREIIRHDEKSHRLLTVDDIRAMLKEIRPTDLNKDSPLIMRRLMGIGPPHLPELICQSFHRSHQNFGPVQPTGQMNRRYYPYYIFQILEAILPEDTGPSTVEMKELQQVLYCIHTQGRATLEKCDREWEKNCFELPEIEWTDTSWAKAQRHRAKAQQHRPL